MTELDWLAPKLEELMTEFLVPGMAVGVLHQGERTCVSAGITHVELGYPVLPDTVFQIGSNTKLLTATVAMRAVELGLLDLDATVDSYLPEFTLADPGLAKQVTVRHLMTHTSGIDGDFPGPPGFSPDMMERYVAALSVVGFLHEPGAMWSYCNAGWALLGRVLEVVFAATYPVLMHRELFEPLGMSGTFVLPEQILTRSVAMGHLPDPLDMSPHPAPVYVTAPACAPAGSVPVSTVGDVLTFLQMHLSGGLLADGSRYLSEETVTAMQTEQFAIPSLGHIDRMGLGWMLGATTDGQRMLGHGGGTLGQISVVELVPDQGLAVVTLSNAFGGALAGVELMKQVLDKEGGVQLPPRPSPPDEPLDLDLDLYAGTYRRNGTTVEVTVVDRSLQLVIDEEPLVPEARTAPPMINVEAVDAHTFASQAGALIRFVDLVDGRPTYLFNFRLLKRVGA